MASAAAQDLDRELSSLNLRRLYADRPGRPARLGVAGQGRFDNNYLEIEAGSFTLGAGNLELGVYRIESIDTSSDPDHKKIYRLHHHADEGYPDALLLTYQTDPFPILRVGASPEPWTRAPSSP